MSAQSTEIRTLGPGSVVSVEDMDPTHRALLMFLANKTANTRAAYEEDLKQFWSWCESFPVTPLAVDKIHVQLYLEHLQGKGLAQATVARRFGTVRLFLRMAYDEEIIRQDLLGIAESLRHVDSRVTRQSYIGLDSGRGALTRQRVSSVYAQMSG